MKFLKRIIDFVLFGNIYVALGAFSLCAETIIQLDMHGPIWYYALFSFFATLFVYNIQRIILNHKGEEQIQSVRRQWLFKNQHTIKALALIGLGGTSTVFFLNDYRILFYLLPLLFLSLAYFIPQTNFRRFSWLKLFTLVTVWVMVTSVLPLLLSNKENRITVGNILPVFTRLCYMFAICIPFDIRDIRNDKEEGIHTLPNSLGEMNARWVALFFCILCAFLLVFQLAFHAISFPLFTGMMIVNCIVLILILFCKSNRSEYYFTAGIDGTMLLQGIAALLVQYLH